MPCYHCATRQTDPGKGPSEWRRGVIGGAQVLICPTCQQAHDWEAELDRCVACGSATLVRSLGETRCNACGVAVEQPPDPAVAVDETLAADVAAALERRFGA